ncbi:MAG: OmpH family outer membrane protein [Gemmataceae bacterium]
MKRKAAVVTGLALGAITIYLGSQLMAQYPPTGGRPPQVPQAGQVAPRIAVLNLGQVIRNYEKYKRAQLEMKSVADRYQADYEKMKAEASRIQVQLQDPKVSAQQREQYEKRIRDLQRDIQDKAEEAKKDLGKREFDILVATYKEVRDVVTTYARSSGIDMVMHYNDGVQEDEFLPPIFSRKLSNGACFPMYVIPQMDITNSIVDLLNRKSQVQGNPVPGPGAAPINVPTIRPNR